MKNKPTWFVVAYLLLLAMQVQAADAGRALQGRDGDVRAAMKALNVPGVAVGIVQDGRVILAKGYGVLDVNGAQPAFGTIAVELADGQLGLKFDAMTLPLQHFNYDTFKSAQLGGLVKYHLDASGKPAEMLLPIEPAAAALVFVKR